MLGHPVDIRWGQHRAEAGALRVVLPEKKPRKYAWVLQAKF